MRVNFTVTNQLATPAIHAAPLAQRPAAGQPGRVFIDTNNPSTGMYRDTGTIWVTIAATSSPEADTLQTVTDRGNTTTQDIAIGTASTPSAPLDVHGSDTIAILQGTGTSNSFLQFNKSGSGKFKVGNVHNGGNDYFTVYNMMENSDAVLVNISTNNIAIGGHTVTPTYRLDVSGSLRNTGNALFATSGGNVNVNNFTGTGVGAMRVKVDAGNYGLIIQPLTGTDITQYNARGIVLPDGSGNNLTIESLGTSGTGRFSSKIFDFFANSNRAIYIPNTGNVLLNTTTDAGFKLRVNGTSSFVDRAYFTDRLYASGGLFGSTTVSTDLLIGTINNNLNFISIRDIAGTPLPGGFTYIKLFENNTVADATGGLNFVRLRPTINQTVSTGIIYGYRFNPINTNVLGKVYAFYSDSGNVNFSGLPTSSAGLSTGDLWNDAGTLKIA